MSQVLTGDDFSGATISSDVSPNVGYRLLHRLGVGGTASAYFAMRRTAEGEAPAVVKIIAPQLVAANPAAAATFVTKEAVALGRLNETVPPSPFVVRFMDAGTVPYRGTRGALELPWLAIEYVHGGPEGTTLEDRIVTALRRTGHAFGLERALCLLEHVSEGLAEVHRVGVIHRDVTPNNVLCCGSGDGEVFKLSDFGIARPAGMTATLGPGVFGTPGYVAPEQAIDASRASVASDVFGLAATIFFALTGDHLHAGNNPYEALVWAQSGERRSILELPGLAPELRMDEARCAAIDQAIAFGTHPDPAKRPQSARALCTSLVPWLEPDEPIEPTLRRQVSPAETITSAGQPFDAIWTVRREPGHEACAVHSVGWDGDGHCLAATDRGLRFWNGSEWLDAPPLQLPVPGGIRCVRRISPGRWIVAGGHGTLAEYSRSGVTRILRHPDERLLFVDASGDLGDLAVVAAELPGGPPRLCGIAAGRWLKPLVLDDAAAIGAITRLDDTRWLVAGRSRAGQGFVSVYEPLQWAIVPLDVPPSRAYLGCTNLPHRELAMAVGVQGAVVTVTGQEVQCEQVSGAPDLASVSIDLLGQVWAGGLGQLWARAVEATMFTRVWYEPGWHVPFVSILADVDRVVAATADGAVLEGRIQGRRTSSSLIPAPLGVRGG